MNITLVFNEHAQEPNDRTIWCYSINANFLSISSTPKCSEVGGSLYSYLCIKYNYSNLNFFCNAWCTFFSDSISTVEPQSYGLHSYGKLGQPDAKIEYIFGKYHQNFYKISIKWERVIKFSSVTQSFSFNISQRMLHSDHSCIFFMENVQHSIKSWGKLMISELRKFQTYGHPCFPRVP